MHLLLVVAVSLVCVCAQDTYTDKYDTLDLDAVLNNKRLMTAYIKCMLDKGKCTAEGRELKSHIAEALQNGCAKCTIAQREGMRKVIKHLMANEHQYWGELVQKYDPKKIYSQKYESEISTL